MIRSPVLVPLQAIFLFQTANKHDCLTSYCLMSICCHCLFTAISGGVWSVKGKAFPLQAWTGP
jgi:hypothetical protein